MKTDIKISTDMERNTELSVNSDHDHGHNQGKL